MSKQGFIDINMNDMLTDVIRKVNTNFKLITQSFSNERSETSTDIDRVIDDFTNAIGGVIDDFNHSISVERTARQDGDSAIENMFDNYTETEDLSAVALSGDYADLSNLPPIPSLEWQELYHLDNTSGTTAVSTTLDIDGYNDIIITDKMDQMFFAKVAMPDASHAYTLPGGYQFDLKLDSLGFEFSVEAGSELWVYAR